MVRWQYGAYEMGDGNAGFDQDHFCELGECGWELVQIVNGIAWFKRPVEGNDG